MSSHAKYMIKNINKRIFESQYQSNYIGENHVYDWFSKTANQFKEVATEFTAQRTVD